MYYFSFNLPGKCAIIFSTILLFFSCGKTKITNVTEARHFLASHSWHTDDAQFYDTDGKSLGKGPSGVQFSETEIIFNKESHPYTIAKSLGGQNDKNSHDPYFVATAWDNYSKSPIVFYLMEDGSAWLENSRVGMHFFDNENAKVDKMVEKAEIPKKVEDVWNDVDEVCQ